MDHSVYNVWFTESEGQSRLTVWKKSY